MTTENVTVLRNSVLREAGRVLQDICHACSLKAGWWLDPHTGENQAETRPLSVIGWKVALIHSEVSEATEGFRKGKMDEHLPHRTAAEVELADAVIRICDLAGAYGMDLGGAIAEKITYNETREDHKLAARAAEGGKVY